MSELLSLREAAGALVRDGDTVALEGFTHLIPHAEGYARCCEAIGQMDLRSDLARIKVPTTVILGRLDPVIDDDSRRLLADLGPVVELDAAHLANVEQPAAFGEAVLAA